MKNIDYGKGYKYAHDHQGNFTELEFMPEKIKGQNFYDPGNNPRENDIRKRLKFLWKISIAIKLKIFKENPLSALEALKRLILTSWSAFVKPLSAWSAKTDRYSNSIKRS